MINENSNITKKVDGSEVVDPGKNQEPIEKTPLRDETLLDRLIEEKLNQQRSLETLLRIQFSEYKNSINNHLAFYASLVMVAIAVSGFFGYSFIKSQVGTQLDAKLITPEVNKTVKDALETQSKNFVVDKINPLKESIGNIHTDLDKLQSTAKMIDPLSTNVKELAVKIKSAQSDLTDISGETATIRLYYDVRKGERTALNDLIKIAKETANRRGMLAKTLLDDLNLYFKDYKYSFQQQQVISIKTRQHIRPPAEQLYNTIYKHTSNLQREAEINEIRDRKLKYFVQDLVKVTRDDPNLKVACRAVTAIENLTGEHFEDNPPYYEVQRWWDKIGSKEKQYMNSLNRLDEAKTLFEKKEFDKALTLLEEITNSHQGMCLSHSNIAKIYLLKGDKNRALQHFKTLSEECDAQIEPMFHYASLLYQDGKKDEVFEILSKVTPYVEDPQLFEKQCRSAFPSLANEDRFKKLFGGK